MLVVVLLLGAVQLICMGIMGEYVRLIFLESKSRPTYIVRARNPQGETSEDEPPSDQVR